jgi:hypothetical protein
MGMGLEEGQHRMGFALATANGESRSVDTPPVLETQALAT